MRLSLLATTLLAGAIGTADAQLYKWVDQDGKVTYADTPPPKDAKDALKKNYTDNVTPAEAELPFGVKDAIKRNPVTLYANACGQLCDQARALLTTRGIPFADRNPETNKAARDTLNEAAGGMPIPTLTVGARVLKGFAESEWQDALSSSGYPRFNPAAARPKPAAAAAPPTPAAPAPAPTSAPKYP